MALTEDNPLAYKNSTFIDSDEARPLRILAEYLAPLSALQSESIQDTIVFFGPARITLEGRWAAATRRPANSRAWRPNGR